MRQMLARSQTAVVTQVASSATVVDIMAADESRLWGSIFNESTQVLTLKFGAGASTTSLTVKVASGGYYEVPQEYAGLITGLWVSANGFAYVTVVR